MQKLRIKCFFIELTSLKRFSIIYFLHNRKMLRVNDLNADEICQQKNSNAAKCEEKFIMRPFL